MIKVYEATMTENRTFRIVIENKNQEARLRALQNELKGTKDEILNLRVITNGIHKLKEFKKLMQGVK